MAPRRGKAQASSSQPKAVQRPSRTTRGKRRHSDSEPQATPAKRSRRAAASAKSSSQGADEVQDDGLPGPASQLQLDLSQELASQDSELSELEMDTESRRVQFSDDHNLSHDNSPNASSAAQVSLQKMSVKRRATLSPAGADIKRFRIASGRQSLPAESTESEMVDTPMPLVQLRDVLESRVQELLEQAPPQKKPDGRQAAPDLTLFDNMKVIDDRKSMSHPVRKRISPPTVRMPSSPLHDAELDGKKDSLHDHAASQFAGERRRLKDLILSLSEETERQRSTIQIHRIELQSITSAEDGTTIAAMIQDIRQSYERAREGLYATVPETEQMAMNDIEMLDMVVSTINNLAEQINLQSSEFVSQDNIEIELRKEVNGLIDRLALSEVNNKRIEAQRIEAIKQVDMQAFEIVDIKESRARAHEETAQFKKALAERGEQLLNQEKENEHLLRSAERLKESLRSYREEDQKMQDLITRMETDHAGSIAKMNLEREMTIRELEDRFDAEVEQRTQSEALFTQRAEQVAQLEDTVEELQAQRSQLQEQIKQLDGDTLIEQDGRSQAEIALQMRDTQIGEVEMQVTALEQELDTLNNALIEVRGLHAAAQDKLTSTEGELRANRDRVKDLDSKLREAGLDANKLRQKMFEVQQKHEAQVAELKQAVEDQSEQYKSDIDQEIARRELAETALTLQAGTTATLKQDLQDLGSRMATADMESTGLLQQMGHDLVERDNTIVKLKNELQLSEEHLHRQVTQATEARQQHDASRSALQDSITDYEARVAILLLNNEQQAELHQAEINEREAAMVQLEHDITGSHVQIAALQSDKAGLERRLADEADQMLQAQIGKQDEIDALRELIEDKQRKTALVEAKAREIDMRWEELMQERRNEVAALRGDNIEKNEMIDTLNEQVQFYRDKLTSYVSKVDAGLRSATDATARANDMVQMQRNHLEKESRDLLEELEGYSEETVFTVKHSSTSRTKKHRAYDSGIGVASDDFEANVMTA